MLSNQVYSLSNASEFGVSYMIMGGKKLNEPIVYSLTCNNGKIEIFFHTEEKIKNEITQLPETLPIKIKVGEIQAVPGTLFIDLKELKLPKKMIFDGSTFHHEVLVNAALPYWISQATKFVSHNRIAPVWLICSKLIELTAIDDKGNLDIYQINKALPFTVQQWNDILVSCAKELPQIPQFTNALKAIEPTKSSK